MSSKVFEIFIIKLSRFVLLAVSIFLIYVLRKLFFLFYSPLHLTANPQARLYEFHQEKSCDNDQ